MKLLVLCVCLALVPCLTSSVSLRDQPLPSRAFTAEKSGRVHVGDIWKNCGEPGGIVKINSVKITPDPPEKGKPLMIAGNVTTSGTISGGTAEIKLKYSIITVIDQKEDVCEILKDASLACPLVAGTYTVSENATIPDSAPGGHYTGSLKAHDSSGKELLCIDLDFHL